MKKIKSFLKNDSGKLAKKSGLTLIIKLSGMGAGYLLTFFVTLKGGGEAWGNYALAYALLQICATLGQFGVDTASIRFVSEYNSHNQMGRMKDFYIKALSVVLLWSFIVSVALYFLAPIFSEYIFKKAYLTDYIKLAAFGIIPQTLTDLHAEMFKGYKKPGIFAFFMYVATYLFSFVLVAAGLLLFQQPVNSWYAFKDTVIGLWIIVAIAFILWHAKVKFNKYIREHSLTIKEILKVSGPMMITMSILLIMGWTDTLMLGALMDNTQSVGVYNVALKIATTVALALMAVNSVSTPRYAEFFSKNEMDKLKKVVRQSTRLVFWISLPMCLICIIVPSWIMSFFGEEFRAGAMSLAILAFGRFVSSACGSVGYILQMTGHEKIMQNIMIFACVLNIVLNWLLIPVFGITGSAMATTFSTITWNIIAAIYIRKKLSLTTVYIPYLISY